MTNNGLGLSAPTSSSSNLVDVKTMSTGETFYDITWYQKWVIKECGYYYTIENRLVDENVFLAVPDGNNSNGSQIVMKESLTDTSLRAMWNFHPYTGSDIDGMGMIRFTTGVAKGSSFRYEAFSYSTTIGRNGPATFSVTDRNGNATNKATITSSSGTLRGIEMGEAQIRTTYSGAPWLWLWNIDIQFEEGIYMFRTEGSEKYIESINNSGSIQVGAFDCSDYERWVLEYNRSKGCYQIKNKNTNLYLTAPSSDTGSVLEQSASTAILDRQLWCFSKLSNGYYKLQSNSKLGSNFVLSRGKGLFNGNSIRQEAYSDDSDCKDEWAVILPISGSEIVYDAEEWNNNLYIKGSTNCYSYAFNNQVYCMQPGSDAGYSLSQSNVQADIVTTYVQADSQALGFVFEPIDKYEVCSQGTYKVALVIDSGNDYHWYRQNSDGTWSHKRGLTEVILVDASGDTIYDPETADRNYGISNYDTFVGFFKVTPLNYLYDFYSRDDKPINIIETNDKKGALPNYEDTLDICAGMTYSNVTNLIGAPQRLLTSGVIVVEYKLSDGSSMIIEYIVNFDNNLVVSRKNYVSNQEGINYEN